MKTFIYTALIALNISLAANTTSGGESVPEAGYSKIISNHPEEIIQFIKDFPLEQYQIYPVRFDLGLIRYWVDSVADCIKNELRSGRQWEPHFNQLIALHAKKGSTVIDVGAHIGTHTILLSKCVGPQGRVYAFEPQPKTFRELFHNLSLNQADNVFLLNAAAGAISGDVELYPLNKENEGATGIGTHLGTGKFAQLVPIDDLKLENVSLIKIDVEGTEMDVLRGAAKTIARDKPILLIEIYGGSLPETASPEVREEIYRRCAEIESMGYKLHRLFGYWDYIAYPGRLPD